jgi:hypothetical protein
MISKIDYYFSNCKINEKIVHDIPYEYVNGEDKLYSLIGKAPRSKKELAILASVFMEESVAGVHNDNKNCCEHALILDAIWDAYSEIEDFSIWYAARGSGKTYDLSFLSFIETIYKKGCYSNILGGSLEQAVRAVAYFNEFWSKNFYSDNFLINKQISARGFQTVNNSWVKALAASPKSIRGGHPSKLRIDEADELDKKLYNASLGQAKAKNGHKDNIIISSTLHNPFGLMSDILDNVIEVGGKLYKWCIHDVTYPWGFWTVEEVLRKKRQVPKAMWETEYECKRPKIGDTIFDFESINRAYKRGYNIAFDENITSEGCIDWGYTCTVLHIIQDMKEYVNIPNSYSWEQKELTDRCKEIIDLCIEKKVFVIYCDSNPKDNYVTLRKLIKKKRARITVMPVAFSVWKTIGISVLRFYLEKNLVNIKDHTFQDKLKKYHYKDAEKEIIDKKDDHYPDAWIAWGATKWRILGYLTKKEKEKLKKKEENLIGKINIGTY